MMLESGKGLFIKENGSPINLSDTTIGSIDNGKNISNNLQIILNNKSKILFDILSEHDVFYGDFVSGAQELIITDINKILEDDNHFLDYIFNQIKGNQIKEKMFNDFLKYKGHLSLYGQVISKKNKIFLDFDLGDGNIIQITVKNANTIKNLKNGDFCRLNVIAVPSNYIGGKFNKGLSGYDFSLKNISEIYSTEKFMNKSNLPNNMQGYFGPKRNISLRELGKTELLIKDFAYHLTEEFLSKHGFTRVNSPKIVGTAIEGPVDVFPVSYFGQKGALALSDVLYQILAVSGGFSRVYEIGPNFRQDPSKTKMHNSEYDCITFHGVNIDIQYMINFVNKLLYFLEMNLKKQGINIDSTINTKHIPIVEFCDIMKLLNENGWNLTMDNFHYIPLDAKSVIEAKYGRTIRIINQSAKQNPFYTETFINGNGHYLTKDCELRDTKITSIANGGERIINKEKIISRLNEKGFDLENFKSYISIYENGILPHGGLGMGIDRLLCFLTGCDDVKKFKLSPRAKGLKLNI